MWVETSRHERVLRIALNRPEKRNALNLELCRELVAAIETAEADPRIGAILLGANGKAFCAGMDLRERPDPRALGLIHEQLFTVHARLTKPLVAAVRGAALAGGTGLVANAHVAVAAEDATFGLTEIRVGLWPFLIFRGVTLAVGERCAVELALTGRNFSAQEALGFGLIHQVSPEAEVESAAMKITQGLSRSSAAAMRSGLEYAREIRGKSWSEAGDIGRRIREQALLGADFEEGVAAFLDKRTPIWPSIPK